MDARKRLGELLDQRRMDQAELARRIGRSPDWVNQRLPQGWHGKNFKRKRLGIDLDDVPLIASGLGITCPEFLAGTECLPDAARREPENQIGTIGLSVEDEAEVEFAADIATLSREERAAVRKLVRMLDRLTEGPDRTDEAQLAG